MFAGLCSSFLDYLQPLQLQGPPPQGPPQNWHCPWCGGMMGWGMGWLGPVMMLVFWIVLIVAAIYAIKWLASSASESRRKEPDSALEILKKRYARGEISKEEFEEKKKDLA